jgi:myo-inositol-1(or 4)-monophosphatase
VSRDPVFISTAIEAVVRAGDIMMSRFGGAVRIDKKGTIDLVTEVDLAIERMFRDLVADRFPHAVLGEEMGSASAPAGPCWIFDRSTARQISRTGSIFCSSLAHEIDGVGEVAAVSTRTAVSCLRPERGGGAFLNRRRSTSPSASGTGGRTLLVTGFPTMSDRVAEIVGFGVRGKARAVRRLGSAAIDLCYVAAGRFDGFWEAT